MHNTIKNITGIKKLAMTDQKSVMPISINPSLDIIAIIIILSLLGIITLVG